MRQNTLKLEQLDVKPQPKISFSPVSYERVNYVPSVYINDEHRVKLCSVILAERGSHLHYQISNLLVELLSIILAENKHFNSIATICNQYSSENHTSYQYKSL